MPELPEDRERAGHTHPVLGPRIPPPHRVRLRQGRAPKPLMPKEWVRNVECQPGHLAAARPGPVGSRMALSCPGSGCGCQRPSELTRDSEGKTPLARAAVSLPAGGGHASSLP